MNIWFFFILPKDFISKINWPKEKCFPIPLGEVITTESRDLFQNLFNQVFKFWPFHWNDSSEVCQSIYVIYFWQYNISEVVLRRYYHGRFIALVTRQNKLIFPIMWTTEQLIKLFPRKYNKITNTDS